MLLPWVTAPLQAASTVAGDTEAVIDATTDLVDRAAELHERTRDGSHASVMSHRSVYSVWSWFSAGSALSVASAASFGSIASAGSLASAFSAGSILSIGSTGSILSIGSTGSVCAIGGRGQMGPRAKAAVKATGSVVALAALVAAIRD